MTIHLVPWMSLLEALSSEVVRKLRLAGEADTKDDRDIICEEVFCDVTGLLDETAQAQLDAPARVPFYVVLAQHYATPRGADSAVAVLHLLQSLYGQGYAAPLVALLLHRWLLLRRAPGRGLPEEQCTRLANVLALGSAQLFLGDVHGGTRAFEPLWRTLCYEVILGAADAPPAPLAPSSPQRHLQPVLPQGQPLQPPLAAAKASLPGDGGGTRDSQAYPAAAAATAAPGLGPGSALLKGSGGIGSGRGSGGAGSGGSGGGALQGPAGGGLASLAVTARVGVLASVASYLLYYAGGYELADLLRDFPAPTAPPAPSLPSQASQPSPNCPSSSSFPVAPTVVMGQAPRQRQAGSAWGGGVGEDGRGTPEAAATAAGGGPGAGGARRPPLVSPPWHGVDFVLSEVVDMLTLIRSEAGLVHYLAALQRLGGQPVLQQWGVVRLDTRLRLQSTLYSLSSPGGPHYAPPAVRSAALAALDGLFPAGRTTRWLVRMLFRLLHPADWLGDVVCSPLALVRAWLSHLALSCFLLLHSLVLWGAWGRAQRDPASSGGTGGAAVRRASASMAHQRHPKAPGGARLESNSLGIEGRVLDGGGPSMVVDTDATAHHYRYIASSPAPH